MTAGTGFQRDPRVNPIAGDVFTGKNGKRTETRTVRFESRFHVYYSLGDGVGPVSVRTRDMFLTWAEKAEVILRGDE